MRSTLFLVTLLAACGQSTPKDTSGGDTATDCQPAGDEVPYDGLDNDCDVATPDDDLDGDGYDHTSDCDDANAAVNPATTEAPYDGLDNDCSAATPDDDLDGDGYDHTSDCDDANAAVNPGTPEVPYDALDNDCDAATPDDDQDADGYGRATDCDEANPAVNPGATETCDGLDDDCDGVTDGADAVGAVDWHPDADHDLWGSEISTRTQCEAPDGYVADASDCNDYVDTIHPGAPEVCDELDNDCDGVVDGPDPVDTTRWAPDADGDGYGSSAGAVSACTPPDGYVEDASDCNDGSAAVHPGAAEVCDGVDNDCDGAIDGTSSSGSATWYADADGDGYGDPSRSTIACGSPAGYVSDATDCDDAAATTHPGARERCDGIDNDCNGTVDDSCSSGGSCADLTVAAYYDSFSAGSTPIEQAAALAGFTVTASSSGSTFGSAYDAGVDVVVVDVPGSSLPTDVTDRLSKAISDGAIVLFSYWYLGYDDTTANTLGVRVVSSYSTPRALSAASDSTLWSIAETLPDSIKNYSDDAGTNGETLEATDAAASDTLAIYDGDATQGAILSTFDGQVLVNGFLPWDFQRTDDDADGQFDMAELYVNELSWATGCTP